MLKRLRALLGLPSCIHRRETLTHEYSTGVCAVGVHCTICNKAVYHGYSDWEWSLRNWTFDSMYRLHKDLDSLHKERNDKAD